MNYKLLALHSLVDCFLRFLLFHRVRKCAAFISHNVHNYLIKSVLKDNAVETPRTMIIMLILKPEKCGNTSHYCILIGIRNEFFDLIG